MPVPLTAETAASIAAQAANEKAHSLYDCRPIGVSQTAQLVDGYWLWRERRPRGAVDIEATVVLAADGSPRTVDVTILDNRAIGTRLYRP